MIAKFRKNSRRVPAGLPAGSVVAVALMGLVPGVRSQTVSDPAAASGMTSGLPGVSTARQAELMQVRARAQAARPEAEQAAMERSAEDALARKSQQQLIDDARSVREMKEQAARQLEHQRAASAYRGVSSGEISTWADDSGRVKVERGVPLEVLANLPPEEEEPLITEEEEGFSLFKAPKKAFQGAARAAGGAGDAVVGAAKKGISWIPGLGKEDEMETGLTATPRSQESVPVAGEEKKPGMLSRIPLVGGLVNRDEAGGAAEPSPTAMAATGETAPEAEKKGFLRGLTSKIPFVGGDEEAPAEEWPTVDPEKPAPVAAAQAPAGPANPYAPQPVGPENPYAPASGAPQGGAVGSDGATLAAASEPPVAEEKAGMFSGIRGFVGKVVPGGSDRSSGPASGSGRIDASLFPQEGDPEKLMADSSAGGEKRKLFKLPEVSMPTIPSIASAEPKQPMPKKTFTPANFVVERDGAQFMRFGAGPLGSEAQTLRAGTVVTKTKQGDEWSTIQLADGSTGIVRNGDLKSAGGAAPTPVPALGPAHSGLATNSPSGGVRITSPVSATGAGVSDIPGPPVSIPTSSLSGGNGPIPPASTVVPPIP